MTKKSGTKRISKRDEAVDGAHATYLYCLVASKKAPSLTGVPDGVPMVGKVRALDAGGGLWLLAADAPLSEYAAAPIEARLRDLDWVGECALAHEAIVEHATSLGTVVPMKLFTLFDADERALAHVKRSRKDLDRVLSRIENKEEWGLRVQLDEARALESEKAKRAEPRGKSAGASFLLRKKAEQDASKKLLSAARGRARDLFDDLSARASDAVKRALSPSDAAAKILLEAAFLVDKKKSKTFVAAIERAAEEMVDDGYELSLSGPWPAYHFIVERSDDRA